MSEYSNYKKDNGDGTVSIMQEIYLHDYDSNRSIQAWLKIPRAQYDEDGNLFQVYIIDEDKL